MVLASDYKNDMFPSVDRSREEALSYLRRNALALRPDVPKGYVTVYYEGMPLGLVKNLGNRANNLDPPEWRILT